MQRIFSSIYWHPVLLRAAIVLLCLVGALWLAFEYFNPSPPSRIAIATAFKGGAYELFGNSYQKILKRAHVNLDVRLTDGSAENLKLLADDASGIQVAFVQGGVSNSKQSPGLLSLGRINYQVFWLFYRGTETLGDLTDLKGKRVAIGPDGSGARAVATQVLGVSGITADSATLLPLAGSDAIKAMKDGRADVIFLAFAPDAPIIQSLLKDPDVRLMSVSRTDALTRKFPYLVRLTLPQGVIDFANNIPTTDVNLIGTTNAVVVREDLHPEIVGLLAKTLAEVHSDAGIFQRAGEFPTQTDPEYRVAESAREFYKDGPSYLNKYLPFRLVDIIKKAVAVVLTFAVIVVPIVKFLPKFIEWLVRDRIRSLYRQLRIVEKSLQTETDDSQLITLETDLDRLDQSVNTLGVPARFSDLFFALKSHIDFVRQRLRLRRTVLQGVRKSS